MIAFGAITFMWDTSVSTSLITGGVALMSIIIGAYVAGASYDDAKNGNKNEVSEP
jgi:glucose uptake protein GlcU